LIAASAKANWFEVWANGLPGDIDPYPMPTNAMVLHLTMTNNTTCFDRSGAGNDYTKGTISPTTETDIVNGKSTLITKGFTSAGIYWLRAWDYGRKPPTLAYWCKPDSYTANGGSVWIKQTMEGVGNIYRATQIDGTTHKIQYYYYDGAAKTWASTSTISTGVWTHLTFVSGAWGSKIYINGVLDSTNALTWFNNTAATNLNHTIGFSVAALAFTGGIDDVRIYPAELNDSQVMGLYLKSPTGE
jgi:hypothetical protein